MLRNLVTTASLHELYHDNKYVWTAQSSRVKMGGWTKIKNCFGTGWNIFFQYLLGGERWGV